MTKINSPRVLIVEDDPVNQSVILAFVEKLGCEAKAVSNGRLAVDLYFSSRFDLVLMDCMLPELSGFEAAARIRERERAKGSPVSTPIVGMTGSILVEDHERCLLAGMNEVMEKPLTFAKFTRSIQRWIEVKAPVRPAIDEKHLRSLGAFDEGSSTSLVRDVICIFLNTAPERLRKIRSLLDAGELRELIRESHAFRSSCLSVGAFEFAELWAEIERILWDESANQALPQVSPMIQKAKQEFEKAKEVLERILSQLKN